MPADLPRPWAVEVGPTGAGDDGCAMPEVLSDRLVSWASILDPQTERQARVTSELPIVEGHVALMPDAHLGIGATIGSVIPTRSAVIPSAVGVDIGCGMAARRLYLRRRGCGRRAAGRVGPGDAPGRSGRARALARAPERRGARHGSRPTRRRRRWTRSSRRRRSSARSGPATTSSSSRTTPTGGCGSCCTRAPEAGATSSRRCTSRSPAACARSRCPTRTSPGSSKGRPSSRPTFATCGGPSRTRAVIAS